MINFVLVHHDVLNHWLPSSIYNILHVRLKTSVKNMLHSLCT